MWDALTKGGQSPRNLMLHNIDDSRLIAAVRVGDWKFIRGWNLDESNLSTYLFTRMVFNSNRHDLQR